MSAARWIAGGALSVGLHGAAAGVLALTLAPQPVPPQPVPEAQLDLAAYAVERQRAEEATPPSEAAEGQNAGGAAVAADAIPRSEARPLDAAPETLAATAPYGDVAAASEPGGARLAAAAPDAAALRADTAEAERVGEIAPPAASATAVEAQGDTVAAEIAQAQPVAEALPAPEHVAVTEAGAEQLAPRAAPSEAAASALPDAARAKALAPSGAALAEAVPAGEAVAPAAQPVTVAVAAQATPVEVAARPTSARPAAQARPPELIAAALRPEAAPATDLAPPALAAGQVAAPSAAAPRTVPDAAAAPQTAAPSVPGTQGDPAALAEAAPLRPAEGDYAVAALAWSGDGAMDPQSLAAIQAFMQPGDLASASTATLRDGIEGLLAAVPCARLTAEFRPDTGVLELRGHIPEEGLRGPVLAALQGELGASIPVTDNVLILPRPQCGALSGLADAGLPQSVDQGRDRRIVGADAHARTYRFTEGQRMSFDLTAPDYPAYIYVDFYDAGGNVLHLVPNDRLALELHSPESAMIVGNRAPGGPSLDIFVGPPYGQEIMVSYAASEPLYDGVRPMVEPADAYLAFLTERVAALRTRSPDFKGEWVYFFIATAAD